MDILLGPDEDLYLNEGPDIVLNNSVSQKIKIRLKWFLEEWRWNQKFGLPYFEYLLIKNPELDYFKSLIRETVFNVAEITGVDNIEISVDSKTRKGIIRFTARTDLEVIREEVLIYG